ncbi:uncharacterized protein L969DRAFT_88395 [Mixia osmundae IAM 14324]|nr:uncharacterized protein L969DRAFT_88395 [Mixia osmundae IAM 14324]KEI39005.1 hypothetical protein L969DRAFT_88395 [Mixia osmundae IAM 14324]
MTEESAPVASTSAAEGEISAPAVKRQRSNSLAAANTETEAKRPNLSNDELTGATAVASTATAPPATTASVAIDAPPAPVAASSPGELGTSDPAGIRNGTDSGALSPPPPPSATGSGAAIATAANPHVTLRALIVTQDASIIIGKGGQSIKEIREKAGVKVLVSESIPNNPERILNVSGLLDGVSKAFGLIVRRINDEPFDVPSVPGSRAVTIRFIVPNHRMGSIIGKQGAKIKEIQDASGARLQATESMLPGSTERILSISGVADAIHIAVYYTGAILAEHSDRAVNNTPYRPGLPPTSYGPPPPRPGSGPSAGGYYPPAPPHHDPYRVAAPMVNPTGYHDPYRGMGGPPAAMAPPQHGQAPQQHFAAPPVQGMPPAQAQATTSAMPFGPPPVATGPVGPNQTQQVYIPNELVGPIIGKGGLKINELRNNSGAHIKIMEPSEGGLNPNGERLVNVSGQPANIQMAVQMLYQRLEQEKANKMNQGYSGY